MFSLNNIWSVIFRCGIEHNGMKPEASSTMTILMSISVWYMYFMFYSVFEASDASQLPDCNILQASVALDLLLLLHILIGLYLIFQTSFSLKIDLLMLFWVEADPPVLPQWNSNRLNLIALLRFDQRKKSKSILVSWLWLDCLKMLLKWAMQSRPFSFCSVNRLCHPPHNWSLCM